MPPYVSKCIVNINRQQQTAGQRLSIDKTPARLIPRAHCAQEIYSKSSVQVNKRATLIIQILYYVHIGRWRPNVGRLCAVCIDQCRPRRVINVNQSPLIHKSLISKHIKRCFLIEHIAMIVQNCLPVYRTGFPCKITNNKGDFIQKSTKNSIKNSLKSQ